MLVVLKHLPFLFGSHYSVNDSSVAIAAGGIESVVVSVGVDACYVNVVWVDTCACQLQAVAFP